MEVEEFEKFSKEMIDFIIDYQENIRDWAVLPQVEPGYLSPLLPSRPPEEPEDWRTVMEDITRTIMPGVTHWHSPRFHAFVPSATSYPAIVADILSGAIGCIGFSWMASPACTELEVVMMDWLARMLGLPAHFLSTSPGPGGGVIQGTSSEAMLVAIMAAKARAIRKHPELNATDTAGKLVAYGSDQSHPSLERSGLLCAIRVRLLPSDEHFAMPVAALREAVREDRAAGLIPFYVLGTLGTMSTCANDDLDAMSLLAQEEDLWMHVDASYAGASFICPEFRHLGAGMHRVHSFSFNPHTWMLVNFDCCAMWMKDPSDLEDMFNVDPVYLRNDQQNNQARPMDFRHWQIPLGRRFRALKLWFVLRLYGVANLQAHIRNHVTLAKEFQALLQTDDRFEIIAEVVFGLVCFRPKGSNELSKALFKKINAHGVVFVMQSEVHGMHFLRLAVCSRYAKSQDIAVAWAEIRQQADELFAETKPEVTDLSPEVTLSDNTHCI